MSNGTLRWPRLGLEYHPELDWVVTTYTVESVRAMADAVDKNPHPIQTKTPQGAPAVWDPAVAGLLRALAESPAALKELNKTGDKHPREGLNRAVHVHVLRKLHPKRKAKMIRGDVAVAWGAKDATVKDDATAYKARDGHYRADDAERLTNWLTAFACQKLACSRTEALQAIDADMRDRGAQACAARLGRRKKSA